MQLLWSAPGLLEPSLEPGCPEKAITPPLGSVISVGYQRPPVSLGSGCGTSDGGAVRPGVMSAPGVQSHPPPDVMKSGELKTAASLKPGKWSWWMPAACRGNCSVPPATNNLTTLDAPRNACPEQNVSKWGDAIDSTTLVLQLKRRVASKT